jgi:hypothetical protein
LKEEAMKLFRRSGVAVLALTVMAACDRDYVFEAPPYQVDPPPQYQIAHTFSYTPHDDTPAITSIVVRGEFNGWSGESMAMTYHDGVWSVTAAFDADASYEYKYVFNGDSWAGHMCTDDTWGNPPGGKVDPALGQCTDGGNAILAVDPNGLPAHTFRYVPHESTEEISKIVVRGAFNGWSGDAMAMTFWDGVWRVTTGIEPGTYEYKYVLNDDWSSHMCSDGRWGNPPGGAVDPDNNTCADGGNAVLTK